ncbi:hypothetical protein AA481_004646 [Salmonella enterica subsp. enterica]|nr:hypothetical protein [Salmonella enterica subsp. enterica serovar Abaetetuba]
MLQEINHNILILLSQEAPKTKWRRGHYIQKLHPKFWCWRCLLASVPRR